MLEAIGICEEIAGRETDLAYQDDNRIGDHIWWISDVAEVPVALPGLAPAI